MTKIGQKEFFQGVMLWESSGLSFDNRRVSSRVDSENQDAFFYTFHKKKDVLKLLVSEFYKNGIKSDIIPLSKYTKGKVGFVLETQRHPDFTKEFERWYKDEGGLN